MCRRLIALVLVYSGCQASGNGRLSGRATLVGATDSSGIVVTLAGSERAVTRTTTDGSFEFAHSARAGSLIIASADGTLEGTLTASLAAGQQEVPELSFHPVGTIVGRVTRAGSATGNGAIVVVASGSSAAATSDDDGSFTLAVAPGSYDLVAYTSGFLPGSAQGLTVSRGHITTAPEIDLGAAPTGLAGALHGTARLTGIADASGITVTLGKTSLTTTTAADGSFTLASPSDGNFSLAFDAGPYHEIVPAVLAVAGSSGFYIDGPLYPMADSTLVLPRGARLVSASAAADVMRGGQGERILYRSCMAVTTMYGTTTNDCSLYGMPSAGGTPTMIAGHVEAPIARSPDGKQIAFMVGTSDTSDELWTAAPDGSGARRLDGNTSRFNYSPDGSLLLTNDYGTGTARVIPVAGGSATVLGTSLQTILPAPGGAFVLVRDNCAPGNAPTPCDLERVPTDGSARVKLASGVLWLAAAPAFDRVVYSDGQAMMAVATTGGSVTPLYSGNASSATLTSDGNAVYFIALPPAGQSTLSRVSLSGAGLTTIASDVNTYWLSPGGNTAYLRNTPNSVARVVSIADGQVSPVSTAGQDVAFALSPSGRWVFQYIETASGTSYRIALAVAPAETGTFHAVSSGLRDAAHGYFVLSSDENEIAYVNDDSQGSLAVQPTAGGAATQLAEGVTSICGFSPSGSHLLYAAGSPSSLSVVTTSGGSPHALLDGGSNTPCYANSSSFFIDDNTVAAVRSGSSAPFRFQDGIYRLEAN
jgi:hypothetical protein